MDSYEAELYLRYWLERNDARGSVYGGILLQRAVQSVCDEKERLEQCLSDCIGEAQQTFEQSAQGQELVRYRLMYGPLEMLPAPEPDDEARDSRSATG
jgi:hypothetical protein